MGNCNIAGRHLLRLRQGFEFNGNWVVQEIGKTEQDIAYVKNRRGGLYALEEAGGSTCSGYDTRLSTQPKSKLNCETSRGTWTVVLDALNADQKELVEKYRTEIAALEKRKEWLQTYPAGLEALQTERTSLVVDTLGAPSDSSTEDAKNVALASIQALDTEISDAIAAADAAEAEMNRLSQLIHTNNNPPTNAGELIRAEHTKIREATDTIHEKRTSKRDLQYYIKALEKLDDDIANYYQRFGFDVEATPGAGDRVLFVGSLDRGVYFDVDTRSFQTGEIVAEYNLLSKALKGDILLAHDNLYYERRGSTGLAVSQVAGAAALLRQKFPNLDGAALKQVLLHTGDIVIIGEGSRASGSTGGYEVRKLNLLNALAPAGGVAVGDFVPPPPPTPEITLITSAISIFGPDETATVEEHHAFSIASQFNPIFIAAPRATVTNKGTISKGDVCHQSLGCGAPIILTQATRDGIRRIASSASVTNAVTGLISTKETRNYGILLIRGDRSTITNYGRIETSGDEAGAVCVVPASRNNTITNRGTITITGNSGRGITLDRERCWGRISGGIDTSNNNTINNYGTINLSGTNSIGIYSDEDIEGTKINHLAGIIKATGTGSKGIVIKEDRGNGIVVVRSSIDTTDKAIELANSNRLDLQIRNNQNIKGGIKIGTSHGGAKHIIVVGAGGTISTQNNMHAIEVVNASATITVYGIVSTTATNTNAIRLNGNNSDVTIGGTVSVVGTNAVAIYLRGTNMILTLEATAKITGTFDINLNSNLRIIDRRPARIIDSVVMTAQTISLTSTAIDRNIIVTETGGIIILAATTPAVTLTRSGAVFTNNGDISVMSMNAGAHGVHATTASSGVQINHMAGMITTTGPSHGIFVQGGGNGVVKVEDDISANEARTRSIVLAANNQLLLELGSGETIKGGIQIADAGTDDKGDRDESNDEVRTHSIVIGAGATLTAAENNQHGIHISGTTTDNLIDIGGTVSVSSAGSSGIYVTGATGGRIINSGTIQLTNNNSSSFALHIANSSNIRIELSGVITTRGNNAGGVKVASTATSTRITHSGGRIETVGVGAHGIEVGSASAMIEITGGNITTPQASAYGIFVASTANNTTINYRSGVLTTRGGGATAIHYVGTGARINHLGGSIATHGSGAHGINVAGGGNGVVQVRAPISVAGISAYAIQLVDANQLDLELDSGEAVRGGIKIGTPGTQGNHSIVVKSGATISASQSGTSAIEVTGANTVINIQGSATGQNNSTQTIKSEGANSQVTISGTVSNTSGFGPTAIYLRGAGTTLTFESTARITGWVNLNADIRLTDKRPATVISTTVSTAQAIGNTATGDFGKNLTIATTGHINTGSNALANLVSLIRNGGTFTNHGRITSTHPSASGVRITNQAPFSKFIHTGSINVRGTGIYSQGANTEMSISGSIATPTVGAYAIRSEGAGSKITLLNGAVISNSASGAFAILIRNTNTLTIMPFVKITGRVGKDSGSTLIDLRVPATALATGTKSTTALGDSALATAVATYKSSIRGLGAVPNSANTAIAAADTGARDNAWGDNKGWTGLNVHIGAAMVRGIQAASTRFILNSVAPQASIHISVPTNTTQIARLTSATAAFVGASRNIVLFAQQLSRLQGGYRVDATWETFITNSLGSTAPYLDSSKNTSSATLSATTGAHSVNMLLILPAGDDKASCQQLVGQIDLKHCNIVGGILAKKRETSFNAGDRVLFVGSLTDEDNNTATPPVISNYTVQAGEDFRYDFILSYDDVHVAGDGLQTSNAAARVAGAAALLRHKFPNLDGAGLKQVLIQTADDLGTTGADAINGVGRLNIEDALSPTGELQTK